MQDLAVFISYRRADSSADAGRLYDALRRRFGRENLFMDVDSLRPGEDWVDAIDGAVTRCDVLLAVIGPNWVGAADSEGVLRLEKELDRVRLEIEAALRKNKPVIPVLVEGAAMPGPDDLPESLLPLLRRHAIHISHPTFESDLGALVRALRIIDRARQPEPATRPKIVGAAGVAESTEKRPPLVVTPAPEAALPAPPPTQPQPPTPVPSSLPPRPAPVQAAPPIVVPPYNAAQPPVPAQVPTPAQPYAYAAAPYTYTQPTVPNERAGASPIVLGLLGLGFVLVIGFVLLAALHIGPFAGTAVTSPTPVPTNVVPTAPPATQTLPPATPTLLPTPSAAPPTATLTPPTTSPGQSTYPESAFQPLWAVVPVSMTSICSEDSSFDTPRLYCYATDQKISIWFEKFADSTSLTDGYNGWLSFRGITSGVADCFAGAVPCEGPYKVGGIDPAGRVAGLVDGSDGWLYWTHSQALILGTGLITVDSSHRFADLFAYWENTASVLNYSASPSP